MTKPILFLKTGRGYYFPDGEESEIMFEHLLGQTEYNNHRSSTSNVEPIRVLARLHGWDVKIRKTSEKDFEDDLF